MILIPKKQQNQQQQKQAEVVAPKLVVYEVVNIEFSSDMGEDEKNKLSSEEETQSIATEVEQRENNKHEARVDEINRIKTDLDNGLQSISSFKTSLDTVLSELNKFESDISEEKSKLQKVNDSTKEFVKAVMSDSILGSGSRRSNVDQIFEQASNNVTKSRDNAKILYEKIGTLLNVKFDTLNLDKNSEESNIANAKSTLKKVKDVVNTMYELNSNASVARSKFRKEFKILTEFIFRLESILHNTPLLKTSHLWCLLIYQVDSHHTIQNLLMTTYILSQYPFFSFIFPLCKYQRIIVSKY